MRFYEGHEIASASTVFGGFLLLHRTLPKGWIQGYIHRQPILALSTVWFTLGFALPLIVPPIRRTLNLATHQYDDPNNQESRL